MLLLVNKLENVASCISTHQMFLPEDEQMKNNRQYFVEEEAINIEWFTPRDEALKYFNRDKYEKHLIEFIDKQFVFDDDNQMDIYGTIENDDLAKERNKSEVCVSSPLKLTIQLRRYIVHLVPTYIV